MDGRAVLACITPVVRADGKSITTIEGLAQGDSLHPAQEAFLAEDAAQCGFCTPGMIMGTVALLDEIPNPSDDEIVERMDGHVCRCCAYPRMVDAIRRAAGGRAEGNVS